MQTHRCLPHHAPLLMTCVQHADTQLPPLPCTPVHDLRAGQQADTQLPPSPLTLHCQAAGTVLEGGMHASCPSLPLAFSTTLPHGCALVLPNQMELHRVQASYWWRGVPRSSNSQVQAGVLQALNAPCSRACTSRRCNGLILWCLA